MGKFKVECSRFPREEIEAEAPYDAAWDYCEKHELYEDLRENWDWYEYEDISVFDEKGQKTTFRAEIIADELELSRC
ncbi:MAG: hypothetical protein [Bacteriophage sp.]|nr:MAG: hypothetical protein [Bacteriophage sp.]